MFKKNFDKYVCEGDTITTNKIPQSYKKSIFKAMEEYNRVARSHYYAKQRVENKREEYNKLPEQVQKYREWAQEESTNEFISALWAQNAEKLQADYDAGESAFIRETVEESNNDCERYASLARDYAESLLDECLAAARLYYPDPERPFVSDPLNLTALPFCGVTLKEWIDGLSADKKQRNAAKAAAREQIPAYQLQARILNAELTIKFVTIPEYLINACTLKDDNNLEALTSKDYLEFPDAAAVTTETPTIARRHILPWLKLSDCQQLECEILPDGLEITTIEGTDKTRALFKWVKPDPAGLRRPVHVLQPVTMPAHVTASV